jgi:hypothetical protein
LRCHRLPNVNPNSQEEAEQTWLERLYCSKEAPSYCCAQEEEVDWSRKKREKKSEQWDKVLW